MGAKGLPRTGDRKTQALAERVVDESRPRITASLKNTSDAAAAGTPAGVKRSYTSPFDGDGKLHQGVEIAATNQKAIYHGLGRKPRGWIVTRIIAGGALDGGIRELAVSPYISDSTKIYIRNDATEAITIDLRVF